MKLSNAELILNLTEPVFRQIVRVNAHLRCLALQDTLVLSVVRKTRQPISAVRADTHIGLLCVEDEPIYCAALDDFAARLIVPKLSHSVFKIMTRFHGEVLLFCGVKTELAPP